MHFRTWLQLWIVLANLNSPLHKESEEKYKDWRRKHPHNKKLVFSHKAAQTEKTQEQKVVLTDPEYGEPFESTNSEKVDSMTKNRTTSKCFLGFLDVYQQKQ